MKEKETREGADRSHTPPTRTAGKTTTRDRKHNYSKTKKMTMNKSYVSPSVEAMEVEVEEGFAVSVAIGVEGNVNNFNTNPYGSSGSTMEF